MAHAPDWDPAATKLAAPQTTCVPKNLVNPCNDVINVMSDRLSPTVLAQVTVDKRN
jgi:hypothetical protein